MSEPRIFAAAASWERGVSIFSENDLASPGRTSWLLASGNGDDQDINRGH
jgi:hypothetical protein